MVLLICAMRICVENCCNASPVHLYWAMGSLIMDTGHYCTEGLNVRVTIPAFEKL